MAIIVEDGSVVAGANSYATLEECDAYHLARGAAAWGAADGEAREAAMIRAADHIDASPFRGRKTGFANPMAWPRLDVVDGDGFAVAPDEVPARVAYAQMAAALVELENPGELSTKAERGGRVTREKVGEIEVAYGDNAPARTAYPAIDRELAGLIRPVRLVELGRG